MIKKVTAIICIALLCFSCKSNSGTLDKSFSKNDTDTVWVLRAIKNKSIVMSDEYKPITISFNPEAKSFNGFAGCNKFFGNYEEPHKGELVLGDIMSTKMAGPQTLMELEKLFISTLRKVNAYKLSDKSLELYQNETLALSFDKQE